MKNLPQRDTRFPYLCEEERFSFPDPARADPRGILCTGGNLSPGMLLSAYCQGIFPWFNEEDPILWWSPDPRFVLLPEDLHCSRSMEKALGKGVFNLRLDTNFKAVIRACSEAPRRGQNGTWITRDMVEAYCELHRLGWAHSAEAYLGEELAGGLYGVSIGSAFFGESMFSRNANASKSVFIALVWRLIDEGFSLIDSQVHTSHLESLGAQEIPRELYLERLAESLTRKSLKGNWGELLSDFPASSRYRRIIAERNAHAS